MAWLLLVSAGVLEIVWATAFKESAGFTRFWPSAIGLVAAAVSFVLLTLSLRSLPLGTAYAIWVGIGVVGVAIVGMVALDEPASAARLGFIALILVGIVGLKLVEG